MWIKILSAEDFLRVASLSKLIRASTPTNQGPPAISRPPVNDCVYVRTRVVCTCASVLICSDYSSKQSEPLSPALPPPRLFKNIFLMGLCNPFCRKEYLFSVAENKPTVLYCKQ